MPDAAAKLNLSNHIWLSAGSLLRARKGATFAGVGLTESVARAIGLGLRDAVQSSCDELRLRIDDIDRYLKGPHVDAEVALCCRVSMAAENRGYLAV